MRTIAILEKVIFAFIAVAAIIAVMLVTQGCTTLTHNPECVCECTDTKAHFECGGNLHHEEVEIK